MGWCGERIPCLCGVKWLIEKRAKYGTTDDLKCEENIQNVSDLVVPACQSQTLTPSASRARATLNLAKGNMLKCLRTAKFLALVYSRTLR